MDKSLSLTASISINAPIEKVWLALTDKEAIKKYFWGTETNTDWKQGSSISFTGTGVHFGEYLTTPMISASSLMNL